MAVTNFEEETIDLTPEELELLPLFIRGFSKHRKDNPVLSGDIVNRINQYLKSKDIKTRITGVKVRKFSNYIRNKSLLPLIATKNGYYISEDKEEIKKQIKSLKERANSILKSAEGLTKFL
jgi:hypothetical protein